MLYCGGSVADGPYRLMYSNAWSSVGGTVWKGLEGVDFLEEVCHRGWAVRFQKPAPFQVSFLCLVLVD